MYFRMLMRWASSDDIRLIEYNPLRTYPQPKPLQRDEEVVVIPRNEVPIVIAALQRSRGTVPDWSHAAELTYQTGLRTGELFAARWEDIRDGQLLIHSNMTLTHGLKHSTKTNKKRRVPLNDRAIGLLDALPRTGDLIYPPDPWNRQAYQSFFRRRMQQLHSSGLISHVYRPYDLRHSALSRWLEAGIPVTAVAKMAGNTAAVVWRHYANNTQDYAIPVL